MNVGNGYRGSVGKKVAGNSEPRTSFSFSFSRSRDKNGATDFAPDIGFISTGAATLVVIGAAKNDAAIVLKSGIAEFVEPACKKSNKEELEAGAPAPFTAGPNCGAFTGTVVLARQICTSQTKVVLFWAAFRDEKDIAN